MNIINNMESIIKINVPEFLTKCKSINDCEEIIFDIHNKKHEDLLRGMCLKSIDIEIEELKNKQLQ